MSLFTGFPATELGLPITTNEENPTLTLGQAIYGDDGRKFIYVKAGGANLAAATVVQSVAEDTGDEDIAAATPVSGPNGYNSQGQNVLVTAAMTVTKNQYAGGYVGVTTSTGAGRYYRIKSHQAFTAAAATFILEDQIEVTLSTSSRLDFVANPANGVVIGAVTGSATGAIAGVTVSPLTAGYYGFVQVAGPALCTNDAAGAITVGQTVQPSASVAGAVRVATAGVPYLGIAMEGIAASQAGFVNLKLA